MNGSFSRDPKTEKDTFTYKSVNDVFGGKIVSLEHYNPPSSTDSTTNHLITKKQKVKTSYTQFYLFGDNLTKYKKGNKLDEPITFRMLYDNNVQLLNRYLKEINEEEENKLYTFIKNKLDTILDQMDSHSSLFNLDSPISEHPDLAAQLSDEFMANLSKFESYICTPLTINGIENKIQYTFINDFTSIKKDLSKIGVTIDPQYDKKHADTGRKAIHVDGFAVNNNYKYQFEYQFLTFPQFIKDIERKFKCTCLNAW